MGSFDDETVYAPPKIWYDQMGAWEIQNSPYGDAKSRGKVMRQVVPVWPACWGYSCSGPTTYFGPAEFNGDLEISMDVRLEDNAIFTMDFLDSSNKGTQYQKVDLDTKGTFAIGKTTGNVDFGDNKWHSISIRNGASSQTLKVDGKIVANVTLASALSQDGTCDDSSFPHDLAGYQAMGLSAGPSNATTVDACRQACCDAGSSCDIYQFSEHPSRAPDCWIGKTKSFVKDTSRAYQSRSKVDPGCLGTCYHLKVALNRYIFASIDNFKIQQGVSQQEVALVV